MFTCTTINILLCISKHLNFFSCSYTSELLLLFLLACVGEDDNGPVVMFISERLDQMDQVSVLHLLWGQDVPLVQLLHCSCSGEKYITITFV